MELKPCPFCGKEEQYKGLLGGNCFVHCGSCGSRGPGVAEKDYNDYGEVYEAVEKVWNDRQEGDEVNNE